MSAQSKKEDSKPSKAIAPRWKRIKGEVTSLTFLVAFIAGVVTSLIASAIWDYTKSAMSPSTEPIKQLIAAEARYALNAPHGVEDYMAMFLKAAEIEDQRGVLYEGSRKIEERFRTLPRFTRLVHDLNQPPTFLTDDTAVASTESTVEFDGQRYIGNESWLFIKEDGEWKIARLRYNKP